MKRSGVTINMAVLPCAVSCRELVGIVLGPAVLGWANVDRPVEVMSLIGLAAPLFLAGIEIQFPKLRGKDPEATLLGFVLSFGIAVVLGLILKEAGLVKQPIFLAVLLCATSLGVLVPVLKDAGQINSTFGQLVIAAGSIADFGAVILLSLLFSRESGSTTTKVVLLVGLFVMAGLIGRPSPAWSTPRACGWSTKKQDFPVASVSSC